MKPQPDSAGWVWQYTCTGAIRDDNNQVVAFLAACVGGKIVPDLELLRPKGQLMAAAPELRSALSLILTYVGGDKPKLLPSDVIADAIKALQKAEGSTA